MSHPKITKIEIYKTSLKFVEPFRIALGEADSGEGIAVRIFTDSGLVGVGEGAPYWFITGETQAICFEACQLVARLILGKNPLALEERLNEINAYLAYNSTAKSVFDMALYDLLAKHANLPLYVLLGGEPQEILTDFTIGIGTPARMAEKAVEYMKEGACSIKVKLGTSCAEDVRRIQAIREAVGIDVALRLDANQGWDTVTAIATLKALEPFGIDFCEEPVAHWNNQGLKRVRDMSPIPIMADESIFDHHDAMRLARMDACDFFNIKLAKSGGIHTGLKINAIGEAAGIACMVGGMFETRVGISAGAHLIASCTNIRFADLDSVHHYAEDPVIGGVVFDGCKVHLPDAPGLGADYDPAFLEKMEKITIV
jgi:L-alanine-DL-glutamate epimerase-like enolase superfamily enzyme